MYYLYGKKKNYIKLLKIADRKNNMFFNNLFALIRNIEWLNNQSTPFGRSYLINSLNQQ